MRFIRPVIALAALCAAAACADGASRITAPEAASRNEEGGGGTIGSGTMTSSEGGGTWIGTGNVTSTEPTDTTTRSGGWAGSGN
ncbi:MAG: hypothetical protein AVDCRST_MAG68-1177 [uncultured Gemmatimonadetes bacterium]|uniref:Lipoprotein n=1 Tax=uncultured Gemmatimonadota bacterium TaxID=203437 RepID=A0A6J4KLG8_9BACT|nr:MAG: hypothetical protein AVDCRST_MAG68-1177 [uncultured Gemmatimonadota bacterium]